MAHGACLFHNQICGRRIVAHGRWKGFVWWRGILWSWFSNRLIVHPPPYCSECTDQPYPWCKAELFVNFSHFIFFMGSETKAELNFYAHWTAHAVSNFCSLWRPRAGSITQFHQIENFIYIAYYLLFVLCILIRSKARRKQSCRGCVWGGIFILFCPGHYEVDVNFFILELFFFVMVFILEPWIAMKDWK